MSNLLVVVFWETENGLKAAINLHIVCEFPSSSLLKRHEGMSIPEFFKSRSIPLELMMKTFPGCFVPNKQSLEGEQKINWDTPLQWQDLPKDKKGLQRLANIVGMPVVSFVCHCDDKVPYQQFLVQPA